jgi:hypothetical protein
MTTTTSIYAPRRVTSIGKRDAQAWLRRQLDYERLLASLRKAHAAKHAGKSETSGRGVAA